MHVRIECSDIVGEFTMQGFFLAIVRVYQNDEAWREGVSTVKCIWLVVKNEFTDTKQQGPGPFIISIKGSYRLVRKFVG